MFESLKISITGYLTAREARKILELEQQKAISDKKHKIEMKQLEIEMKYAESGNGKPKENLDLISLKQMENSYKDEIVMFLLFTPIGMAFIPGLQQYVESGFNILKSSMPDWYVYLVTGIVVTIYGLRSMVRLLFSKNKEPKENKENKVD